eukprot:Selendium_serpulae@DN5572_c1_g1_i1.p1
MILDDTFWEEEHEAPLLRRNGGFLSKESAASIVDRASGWIDLMQSKAGDIDVSEKHTVKDEAMLRIFKMDAERTFDDPQRRTLMSDTLERVCAEIDDYHQGLGFIVAYLLLHIRDIDTIAKIVLGLHRHYVEGYFMTTPRAYVRDAKVFFKALKVYFPEAHTKLQSLPPEAFCSKWFIGFNVHVLPFPALIDFFEALLTKGQDFLFQFGLALVKNCQKDIMSAKDVSVQLEILRLDVKQYPDNTKANDSDVDGSFFKQIVEDAIQFDIKDIDVDSLRKEVDEEMRIVEEERAKRQAERQDDSDDEIVFSDEEDED